MADPLSVAGTAVGIVSLGIQVCQGLISYSRSFEGRKQDLEGGLREIQSLLSVFYSLNEILPQLDQKRSFDAHVIRGRLRDSEEALQDLQQLLIKLRGSSTPSRITGKIKEAGRSVAYPFSKDKLTSVHQTLRGLLDNVNLAIAVTSMKSGIKQDDSVDTIKTAVETLRDASHTQNDRVKDVYLQIRDNTQQLQSLQDATSDILNSIEHRLNQTEWSIRDLDQNIDSKLTIIQTSIASNQMVTIDALQQMMGKFDACSANIARMNVQCSHITHPGPNESGHCPMVVKPPLGLNSSALQPVANYGASTMEGTYSTIQKGHKNWPSICNCPPKSHSFSYSYTFCGIKFQYEQRTPRKHRRNCKLRGINQGEEKTYEVQFPVKMGWFSENITRACLIYARGNNNPGISIRFKNIVPAWSSPFYMEMVRLSAWFTERECIEIPGEILLKRLSIFEHGILTIYKNGQSSPFDRDEYGRSHAMTLVEWVQKYIQYFWACDSAADIFLQLLGTLIDFVQGDNDTIIISGVIYRFFSKTPKENWATKQKMLSMLTKTFEIDPKTIPNYMGMRRDITSPFRNFSNLAEILGIELPPIARAIISRSLPELEKIVLCDPMVPTKHILGLTTLQLCASWPQGLRFLLGTEAKRLIDFGKMTFKDEGDEEPLYLDSPALAPIELAIIFGSAESVEVLMKAGCIWHNEMFYADEVDYLALDEVMNSLASNIAARRWLLFEVAERELGGSRYMGPSCVPDSMAARLCKELDDSGIPIAPFLRVSQSYATIYHYPKLRLYHFPIFFENGFRDCASHNDIGLTPVMIWRAITSLPLPDLLRTFPFWLHKQGLLDQKPKDPANLGLNLHATGWHYIASMLCPTIRSLNSPGQPELEWKVMNSVSTAGVRDNCVCWCCVDDKGCSPLISLWKVSAKTGHGLGNWFRTRRAKREFTRHIFFHDNNMFGLDKDKMSASALLLEFLRFLTFEALDMQHTCCTLKTVKLTNGKYLPISHINYFHSGSTTVLVNADPEVVQQIRSNDSEKRLLESLMDEFAKELERMEPSPKMLERFLWGHWRRRMSEIYAVDPNIMDEMSQVVGNIRTHQFPERVLTFLGHDFDLLRLHIRRVAVDTSDDESEDDESSVEDIDVLPPCRYCEGRSPYDTW